jgi:hypothetical protein
VPEVVRVSPVRGRIVYGETVLHEDLQRPRCHKRLLCFSERRTRQRSSILFFIAVAEADESELAALLQRLDIRSNRRGGHVHVIPVVMPPTNPARAARAADAQHPSSKSTGAS